jgi:small conductance mechanosensitive channel
MTGLLPLDPAQVQTALLAIAPRLVSALLVLVAFWLLARLTQPALRGALQRAHFDPALITLAVDGVYRGVLVVLGLVMAASQLGFNVSALLAGVGVAGIALGFAAQETVANMIAGFLIFWDRPFVIGNLISTQELYGEVHDITLRTTRIRTPDNTYVIIPNRQIIGDTLVNHSMSGETRVSIVVAIAYKERIDDARKVLLDAARQIPGVIPEPAPDVTVRSLGEYSVNLEIGVWIANASDERPTAARLLETCKGALDDAAIQIPFPHRQLFLERVDDAVWKRAAVLTQGT